MRTTVTLDADVERLLKDHAHRRRTSFKQVLNDAVRAALSTPAGGPQAPFQVEPVAMGLRAGIDPAHLSHQADQNEIDAFLTTTQKLMRAEKQVDDRS